MMGEKEHHGVRRHGGRVAALEPLPSPGLIVKITTKDAYGITEWQLANGVKVVLKPTDFREDEVLFRATSFGGSSLASDADYIPASSASTVVAAGGVGRLSVIELRKKMTGKTDRDGVHQRGPRRPERLLVEEGPRDDVSVDPPSIHTATLDPAAFGVFQGQMKSGLANQRSNPGFLFTEALVTALRQNHPQGASADAGIRGPAEPR